jgi:hypothetical protein
MYTRECFAGLQAVAVEKTGDQVVASDQHPAPTRPRRCRSMCCCAAHAVASVRASCCGCRRPSAQSERSPTRRRGYRRPLRRVRTNRFFSPSVVGADHRVCRSEASRPSAARSMLSAALAGTARNFVCGALVTPMAGAYGHQERRSGSTSGRPRLRPQRRQRIKPESSASPCLGAHDVCRSEHCLPPSRGSLRTSASSHSRHGRRASGRATRPRLAADLHPDATGGIGRRSATCDRLCNPTSSADRAPPATAA